MTKTFPKFMSDFDLEVANKSISQFEAVVIYDALMRADLHNLNTTNTAISFDSSKKSRYVMYDNKDINKLLDKLVKIMESA